MTRDETVAECKRVKQAIAKTTSEKLKRDYSKYLKKLQKSLIQGTSEERVYLST